MNTGEHTHGPGPDLEAMDARRLCRSEGVSTLIWLGSAGSRVATWVLANRLAVALFGFGNGDLAASGALKCARRDNDRVLEFVAAIAGSKRPTTGIS